MKKLIKSKKIIIIFSIIGIVLIGIGIYLLVQKPNKKEDEIPEKFIPDEIEENNCEGLYSEHDYKMLSFSGMAITHNLKTDKYEMYIYIGNHDTKDLVNKSYILTFYDSNENFIKTKTIKIDYIKAQTSLNFSTPVDKNIYKAHSYKIREKK